LVAKPYASIVAHYEACLDRHGDTPQGVDWPNADDVPTRYRVMLDVARDRPPGQTIDLLDFGCGASGLYEHIVAHGLDVRYTGLDVSPRFIDRSRRKFPHLAYYCVDVLEDGVDLPEFDYVVLNGVLTEKRDLSFDAMFDYAREVLRRVFDLARVGIAFNVMSKHVDWEREDLFHVPFDALARFLTAELSREFVFRADYGLYEYTAYVYR
jgi:SAM-dependent methyltransferase